MLHLNWAHKIRSERRNFVAQCLRHPSYLHTWNIASRLCSTHQQHRKSSNVSSNYLVILRSLARNTHNTQMTFIGLDLLSNYTFQKDSPLCLTVNEYGRRGQKFWVRSPSLVPDTKRESTFRSG